MYRSPSANRNVTRLLMCIVTMVAALALAVGAAAASQASPAASAAGPAAGQIAQGAEPTAGIADAVTSGLTVGSASEAASVSTAAPCKTVQTSYNNYDLIRRLLFWFRLKVRFCWNSQIVTNILAVAAYDVTGTGAAFGWQFDRFGKARFTCWVVHGSRHLCSGRTVSWIGYFSNNVTGQKCYDKITWDVTYKGGARPTKYSNC